MIRTTLSTISIIAAASLAAGGVAPASAEAMAKNSSVAEQSRGRTVPKALRGQCRVKMNRHGFLVCKAAKRKAASRVRETKPYRKG